MLATDDAGVMPWAPLANFRGPPEPLFRRCRETIDRRAAPGEHENLLAVTQVLAKLRYNDPRLLEILGGRRAMIESPLIQELLAESKHSDILMFLESRFGPVSQRLASALQSIIDEQKLNELIKLAGRCRDLKEFQSALRAMNGKQRR